jgi:hypothetical protein
MQTTATLVCRGRLFFWEVTKMRVFIAGIMQGSLQGLDMVAQDYRERIAEFITTKIPEAEIWDPNQIHPNGIDYERDKAKRTLIEMAELAAEADCVVAYVPEASMGTALEMWMAYQASVPVYTISPMTENWVVFTLSNNVFPTLEAFGEFVNSGGLDR